jgi:arylsulfatase A-like enzyme
MFDEVVRVPLIVRLPWGAPRRVTLPAVSVVDIAPTILELAIGGSREMSGASLVGLAEGTQDRIASRKAVLVAYDGIHGQPPAYAWVDGRAKYVLYAWREGENARLFDLQADAAERTDLRTERPEQEVLMRKQLEASLKNDRRRVEASSEH